MRFGRKQEKFGAQFIFYKQKIDDLVKSIDKFLSSGSFSDQQQQHAKQLQTKIEGLATNFYDAQNTAGLRNLYQLFQRIHKVFAEIVDVTQGKTEGHHPVITALADKVESGLGVAITDLLHDIIPELTVLENITDKQNVYASAVNFSGAFFGSQSRQHANKTIDANKNVEIDRSFSGDGEPESTKEVSSV